jgi:hypothetical protein
MFLIVNVCAAKKGSNSRQTGISLMFLEHIVSSDVKAHTTLFISCLFLLSALYLSRLGTPVDRERKNYSPLQCSYDGWVRSTWLVRATQCCVIL